MQIINTYIIIRKKWKYKHFLEEDAKLPYLFHNSALQ
jgi:hypothetical protein